MINKLAASSILGLSLLASPLAGADEEQLDPNAMALMYRQAAMTLVGHNFGPMASMLQGEIPWDDAMFKRWANDLAAVSSIDMMRGFRPGSQVGKTRAKPAIWDNLDDFRGQMEQMPKLTADLAAAAASGDKAAIGTAFQAAADNCKACHDDYKSKDFLNQ